jgi:hypothetical protein
VKRILSFVATSNLVPIALIVLAGFAYLKYARTPAPVPATPGPVTEAAVPKYVQKIEHHHYYPPAGTVEQVLPKEDLEAAKPGSVSQDVLQDNAAQIVARTEIPAHGGPTQVDAIRRQGPDNVARYSLDYRQLPPPFFDAKKEIRGGLYYGVAGENILEAEARLLPLRIGPIEGAVKGRVGLERDGHRLNGALLVGIEF